MATMQEYLEEMARRQATGWTPGVPNRFAIPVATTWNLPSTARTTMRQAVPRVNLGDISAQSNPQSTTKRRGRPKSNVQSISDRQNTGLIKSIAPMLGAISKVAGPAAIAYDALRSDPALADQSAESLAVSQAWQDANPNWTVPSQDELVPVQEVYPPGTPGATLPSFDVTPDAGGAVGGYPTMDADYGTMATEESDYVPADPTGGLIDFDALAGRFEVGPTSVAQHGGYHRSGWFDPFFDLEGLDESMPMPSLPADIFTEKTGPYFGVDSFSSLPESIETQPSKSIGEMYESAASGIGTGIMDAFGIDTQQHMDNVGMINKLSQSDMLDVPAGWTNEMYAAGLKAQDFVQAGANPLLAMAGSYPYQAATEAFRATVDPTISYEEAMNMASAQGLGGLIGAAGGLPAFEGPIGELIDDTVEKNVLGITTPDVTPNMWDTSAISTQAALDPNLQGTTPFSMANATGNLAGYGTSPISMVKHQMGLDIEQPATKYGDPYWDSDSSVQMLVDEDVAAQVDDFSEIAPVTLDTHSRYLDDPNWEGLGKSSQDFENWQMEVLPTLTETTPTIERVREFNAVTAGNKASETAGGLDKIARDRLANQAAIERKVDEDAARINRERKAAEKALEDAQNLARKQENARLNAAKREMLQEARREEAAIQAAAQAEANAAIERVAQAQALMRKYGGRREPAESYMSAAERDIGAAAQVDTFAGMPMGGGFMGADIGREDGGGFTGGDFSGGAGWE